MFCPWSILFKARSTLYLWIVELESVKLLELLGKLMTSIHRFSFYRISHSVFILVEAGGKVRSSILALKIQSVGPAIGIFRISKIFGERNDFNASLLLSENCLLDCPEE